jgi:hypothetical protein
MSKDKISQYSSTASNNTDIGGINIAEGCPPSNINNAIRELMAQVKDFQIGADGDGLTVSTINATTATLGSLVVSSFGAVTATSLNVSGGSVLASANISGALTSATANITTATIGAIQGTTATIGTATLTNPLAIASGGTALTTLTAENVILGNGTSAPKFVAPGTSGNILTSNGTTWTSAAASSGGGGQGQVFTGNGTFTIPTGITKVKVTVVAGGGGGNLNSGGDAGGAAIKYLTSLTPGNTISVTVGAGGATDTIGGSSQIASGTQSITTVSATGGSNGGLSNAQGGIGSNGDLNIRGGGGTGAGGNSIFGGGGAFRDTGGTGLGGSTGGGGGRSVNAGCCSFPGGVGGAGVVIFEW